MDDVVRIINSIEHSSLSIGGVTETVKYEKKKQEDKGKYQRQIITHSIFRIQPDDSIIFGFVVSLSYNYDCKKNFARVYRFILS